MVLTRESFMDDPGLLYPMMVIAAIVVIAFSLVGMASVTGWMPSVMQSVLVSAEQPAAVAERDEASAPDAARASAAFNCGECGMIETIREIERRASPEPGAYRPTSL